MRSCFSGSWKCLTLVALLALVSAAGAADPYGLEVGALKPRSISSLAFGPEGVLFVGDAQDAAVIALQTGDKPGDANQARFDIADVGGKIAAALGAKAEAVKILDLVVNPQSGNVFAAVSTGQPSPALVKIDPAGGVAALPLDKIAFARVALPSAPDEKADPTNRRKPSRAESITDLAYIDGQVLVTGLSSAAAPSRVLALRFPFADASEGSSLEIYHGAHGKLEDFAPARAIVPIMIDGKPNILAGFTCTPLVRIPLASLEGGQKISGVTVAELGNRNRPLDMIAYKQGDQDFLLVANSARGVMKVSAADIGREEGIRSRVSGTAGQPFETIDRLKDVTQLDRLGDNRAVVLIQPASGPATLKSIDLP